MVYSIIRIGLFIPCLEIVKERFQDVDRVDTLLTGGPEMDCTAVSSLGVSGTTKPAEGHVVHAITGLDLNNWDTCVTC